MNMKIDSLISYEAMKSGEASMAQYNNKNGIFKRNSPMSELVVENEWTNEIKNSYFIQVVTLFGGSFAFQTAIQPSVVWGMMSESRHAMIHGC